MITFTPTAIAHILSQQNNNSFELKLLNGGCNGTYWDMYPLNETLEKEKVQSNEFEIYVLRNHLSIIHQAQININLLNDEDGKYLTITVHKEGQENCACHKSFYIKGLNTQLLSFDDGKGLIGSFCQPID